MCERELAGVGRSGEEGADVEREREGGVGNLESWSGKDRSVCLYLYV